MRALPTDISELLEGARAGDRTCLEELLLNYRDRLLERIRLMMGHEVRRLAESGDFMQGLFTNVVGEIERCPATDGDGFLRWATRIVRNNIRDEGRRRRLQSFESFSQAVWQETPSSDASRREQADRLLEGLVELPEDHQRVIELRHFDGRSFAEIGEELGRSENAVQLLHGRALTSLGKILRGMGEG